MRAFTLDTRGEVHGALFSCPDGAQRTRVAWSDLDPFTQGYIEAVFESLRTTSKRYEFFSGEERPYAFTDLAPETLAAILKDCAKFSPRHHTPDRGAAFWRSRQSGNLPNYRLLTVSLGDDGKVRLS